MASGLGEPLPSFSVPQISGGELNPCSSGAVVNSGGPHCEEGLLRVPSPNTGPVMATGSGDTRS